MNASVNDIVECINDKPSAGYPADFKMPIEKGMLYKVTKLTHTGNSKRPAYELEGVPDAWTRTRFRKVEGSKGTFQDWLKVGQKQDDLVDA